MLRSMFSGVSGLRNHQVMMDVVSNNIANVNTTGFKASRTTFQEALSQVVRGASGYAPPRGGVNAMQVGLGASVAAIDAVHTQGATQLTGRATDLAIEGDGFFVMNVAGSRQYTRAGALSLDQIGNLVGPNGGVIQGWMTDPVTGQVDFNSPLEDIRLPSGTLIEPRPTTDLEVGGSLSADTGTGGEHTLTFAVQDSLGESHDVRLSFTKVDPSVRANGWTVTVDAPSDDPAFVPPTFDITFDSSGQLTDPSDGELALSGLDLPGDGAIQDITIDLTGPNSKPLVQYSGEPTVSMSWQNGTSTGIMRNFLIGRDGAVTGQFSNGESKVLGYLSLATFSNPTGLLRQGESMFVESANSGNPIVGRPSDATHGALGAGSIEMSNVDLALEFTNLIIAQRGFQANSRSITTSDEMLNELVNIKR